MSTSAFDALTREAAVGVSRRGSLLTMGAAALAASMANAGVSEAKKKKGKDSKKKEKQRCSKDAAACKPTLASICELTPAECAAAQTCCDECSADGFLTCLLIITASATAAFK
jgi:hypothetical protein